MRSAAELAQRFGAYLQTHLAENREEIEKVRNLHMSARDYTDVYEKCGLLTPKTMLGHCHPPELSRDRRHRGGAIEHRALPDLESFPGERLAQARPALAGRAGRRARLRCGGRP